MVDKYLLDLAGMQHCEGQIATLWQKVAKCPPRHLPSFLVVPFVVACLEFIQQAYLKHGWTFASLRPCVRAAMSLNVLEGSSSPFCLWKVEIHALFLVSRFAIILADLK